MHTRVRRSRLAAAPRFRPSPGRGNLPRGGLYVDGYVTLDPQAISPTLESRARGAHPAAAANGRWAYGRQERLRTPRRVEDVRGPSSLARAPRRAHNGPGKRVHQLAESGARGAGPLLRQLHAAGRIPMQRYDILWSAQGATKPDRSGIGPSGCRVSQILHTDFGEPSFYDVG